MVLHAATPQYLWYCMLLPLSTDALAWYWQAPVEFRHTLCAFVKFDMIASGYGAFSHMHIYRLILGRMSVVL